MAAIIAWPIALLLLAYLFIFGYPNPKKGHLFDILMIIAAIPAFCVCYGIYSGLLHLLLRKYRTKRLWYGLMMHILLYITVSVAGWVLDH